MTSLLILFLFPLIACLFELADVGHIEGFSHFDLLFVLFFAVSHIAFLFAVIDSCYRKPQSPLNVPALILTGILNLLPLLFILFVGLSEHLFSQFIGDIGICTFILLALFIFAIVAGMCAISLKRWQIFLGLFALAILEFLSLFTKSPSGIGLVLSFLTLLTIVFLAFRELARFLISKLRSRRQNRVPANKIAFPRKLNKIRVPATGTKVKI